MLIFFSKDSCTNIQFQNSLALISTKFNTSRSQTLQVKRNVVWLKDCRLVCLVAPSRTTMLVALTQPISPKNVSDFLEKLKLPPP